MTNSPVVERRQHGRCLTAVLLGLVVSVSACERTEPVPNAPESPRGGLHLGVVAAVGDSNISEEFLVRAAAASRQPLRATLDEIVQLRRYGMYVRASALEPGRFRMVERATLARALLERVEAATKLPDTPTDAEVALMTERRWIEFDRPVAAITCHAIVHADRLQEAAGQALARRLEDALRSTRSCGEFLERAKQVPVVGAKVTAERLPPVTPQGRTLVLDEQGRPIDEGETFDMDFARAAHGIQSAGAQSGIVRTAFGWHIILLESRLPALIVPLEERRRLLRDDILAQRAKDSVDQILQRLRVRSRVAVERSAIETIGRLRVDQ